MKNEKENQQKKPKKYMSSKYQEAFFTVIFTNLTDP